MNGFGCAHPATRFGALVEVHSFVAFIHVPLALPQVPEINISAFRNFDGSTESEDG